MVFQRTIIAGIRPEHLRPALKESQKRIKLYVEVTNVEILGNETVFSFKLGTNEWMAKWSGQWHIEIGDSIPMSELTTVALLSLKQNGDLIKKPIGLGNLCVRQRGARMNSLEKPGIWKKTANGRTALLYLLPSIILFSVFVFYPMFRTIYLSFFLTDQNGDAAI